MSESEEDIIARTPTMRGRNMTKVRVKKLEWTTFYSKGDIAERTFARTEIGDFLAENVTFGWAKWWSSLSGPAHLDHGSTLSDAQAAAQADFERRVLSCLEDGNE